MARILFAWELGEGLGHVASIRPVALGLKERGHEVVIAVRNIRSAAVVFAGSGLPFVPCPYQTWKPSSPIRQLESYAQMLSNVAFGDPEGLGSLVAAWSHLYDLVKPDLIIFDHSPSGLLAARASAAKRALLGLGFFAPPAVSPLPSLLPERRPDPSRIASDEARVLAVTNETMRGAGLQELDHLADIYGEVDLDLLMTYEELDHFGPRKGIRYWGVHSSVSGKPPVWPEGEGKKVFAYLKPTPGLDELLLELKRRRNPTIVFGPWVNDQARSKFGSHTLSLVSHPVDIRMAAEQCDLAILNGTHGTTAEMLLRGTPVLQLPIFVEQGITGQKTVAMGAGLMADSRDPRAVVTGLDQMRGSQRYAEAADRFAQKYAGRDSAEELQEMLDTIGELLR